MSSTDADPASVPPPPPYNEVIPEPQTPIELFPEKQQLPEDHLEDDRDLAPDGPPAPPFAVTPGTLILAPCSVLIHSPIAGARALYQLLTPLNGHSPSNCLIDVPAARRLNDNGTLRTIRDHDRLYELGGSGPKQDLREVAVSSQRLEQFHGVKLRKDHSVGITGLRASFSAFSADEEGHARVLYQARHGKRGAWEWHDGGGTLIAVEPRQAVDRAVQDKSLEIVMSLDKRHLDLIVALWIARLYQESQEEGEHEDKEHAKQRKVDHKELDRHGGNPHRVLHDVAKALTFGRGKKRSSLPLSTFPADATTPDGQTV